VTTEAPPIDVGTRFERFPATVKGAFVLRGADGNPHGVSLVEAVVARVPAGPVLPLALGEVVVDVAPSRDLFVPFEAPLTDLPAGWYAIRSAFRVDAGRTWSFAGRPFAVAWAPRENRRGTIRVDGSVEAGSRRVVIERVDLAIDRSTVVWRDPRAEDDEGPDLDVFLVVDGRRVDPVPGAESHAGSERRTVFYPVPRSARGAEVSVGPRWGERSEPVEVALP
jgi:hypothetical protein